MLIFFANVHVIKQRQLIFHGICQFQFLDSCPTHIENFSGGIKILLDPPNILEGNGVVFRNFTFNNLWLEVFTFYL